MKSHTRLPAIGAFLSLCVAHNVSYSQNGSSCDSSYTLAPASTYNYSQYSTSDAYFWFEFTATSPYVNISLETPKFGLDVPHIHTIRLFSGSCGNLAEIAQDQLPFYSEAKYLTINLNASNLQIGQTYYVRVDRVADDHECTKGNCTANNSTDPSTFLIAIKEIFLIIPPDMMVEPPTSGWGMETNRGQLLAHDGSVAEDVKMYNARSNPGVYICGDHISYVFEGEQAGQRAHQRVDMRFENSNSDYDIFRTEELPGFTNYYLPHIPDGVTKNKAYSRVVLNDIYREIDFHQYSNSNGLKNYFIVYPGGKPGDIRMKFDGADSVTIDSANNLKIVAQLGNLQFEKPHVYTVDSTGYPQAVICNTSYQLVDDFTVGFNVTGYSGTEPLIIVMDQGHSAAVPKSMDNLLWSTYYGNTEDDDFEDIDHDDSGNVYYTGCTNGLTFPHTVATVYSPTSDYTRIVVGSHKPLGERNWSTIYGAQAEIANGLATDNLGNVYVTGVSGVYSEANQFLDYSRAGAYNLAPSNTTLTSTYATLYRFNQNNGTRTWATLFGEHTNNAFFDAKCIATDNSGNVYIAGEGKRMSSSFQIIGSGQQHSESTSGTKVGFIAKFSTAGALTWSTMFGNDSLVVNEMNTVFNPQTNKDELFIVGTTSGTNTANFVVTAEEPSDYHVNYQGGHRDAFFAKFDSSDDLRWASFFGGAGDDSGLGIDYNYSTRSLFITGQTKSTAASFPLQSIDNAAIHFSNVLGGTSDGFLAVMRFIAETTGGHKLYYSSYYGGSSDDQCGNIEVSEHGNVYVIGMSKSQDFPVHQLSGNYYQDVLENDPTGVHYDAFVLGLNPSLAYGWATFFGGEWYYNGSNATAQSDDDGNGLTVYNDEILYIGGMTRSSQDFPLTVDLTASPNAYIQYNNSGSSTDNPAGWKDGFLAQFDINGLVLGLEELNDEELNGRLTVYPNPSNGDFSITGSGLKLEGKVTIEIFNVLGQKIYSKPSAVSNGQVTELITLKNLSDGMYVVSMGNEQQKISTKVIVR